MTLTQSQLVHVAINYIVKKTIKQPTYTTDSLIYAHFTYVISCFLHSIHHLKGPEMGLDCSVSGIQNPRGTAS